MEESSDHQQDEGDGVDVDGQAQEGHSGSVGPASGLNQLIDDLSCPICMSLLRDPFVTSCGHTFCCSCLTTHLEDRSTCPSCGQYLIKDRTYPNFLLSKIAVRAAAAERREKKPLSKQIEEDLQHEDTELSLPEVNSLLTCLWHKKEAMEKQESQVKMQLLLQFLHHARSEKTKKLRELHEELTTLDTDIQQVAAQAGPPSMEGPPERPSDAELLRRRIAESADHLAGANPFSTLPGFPAMVPRLEGRSLGYMAGPSLAPPSQHMLPYERLGPFAPNHHLMPPPGLHAQDTLHPPPSHSPVLAALPGDLLNGAAGGDVSQGLLPSLPSLQSTLRNRPAAHAAAQPSAADAFAGQAPQPLINRIPSLDTWGGPSVRAPRNVDAQALSGFHSGSWTPDNSMATSSHPPASASRVASVTPRSTTPTVTSSEGNSDSGNGAGRSAPARLALPHSAQRRPQPSAPISADQSMAGEESRSRKRRVVSQFEDLQACYLKLRKQGPNIPETNERMGNGHKTDPGDSASHARGVANGDTDMEERCTGAIMSPGGLSEFSRMLSVFINCSKLKVIAELPRASSRQPAAILSSIEFDRDRSMFATAGVSKRISLYSFEDVLEHSHVQEHCPASELITRSKLSCLSWNKYVRSHLLSSDYEGCVTLWDVDTGLAVNEYEAHDKRIWSVDFCTADSSLFVSGSDDGWIKAWSTKQAQPTTSIELRANVCCVKYNPTTAHEIAVGSADHNVHLYDLRKSSSPVHIFNGHRKAVSYVRWLSDTEVVSASTDSTLRLWDIHSARESRTFRGHVNEKNFVGLAADSEFIACGSETNEVHVYYRTLAKPIASKLFSGPSQPSEGPQFISAVCWKPSDQTLLAANSQGCVKIMRLAS